MAPTLLHVLDCHARERGDAPGFIADDRTVSFSEFLSMVDRTAAWLLAQGIQPGDRVAVWLVNRIEWLALYFALARISAALMTVNTRYRAHELGYILERSRARFLVMQTHFQSIDFANLVAAVPRTATDALSRVAVVGAIAATLPATLLGKPTVALVLDDLPPSPTHLAGSPDPDTAGILFTTSGTTSGPKLVMHSHRAVATHAQRVATAYGFLDEDVRLLAALPLCGVYGFCTVMAAFAAGRPSVLLDVFDAGRAASAISEHTVTHMFGSDEMYRRLLDEVPEQHSFPSLRVAGYAAFQPGAELLARTAVDRGIPLLGLYGSSEMQALFSMQRPELPPEQRIEAGGSPASPGAEVRIRDVGTDVLLPPGKSGEIEIRTDTSFIGYLDDSAATQAMIDAEGFFRTGDIGHLRDDGSLVYETRQGDVMRLGGHLVSPAEIEEVLRAQDGVADVQVVAVDLGGRVRAVAFATAKPGSALDSQRLQQAAAASLAAFKVPARIWVVDDFPVVESANGTKIQRAKLREIALRRLERGDLGNAEG